MTFLEVIELIKGVLAFPKELLALVRFFQGTSAAQRSEILATVQAEKQAAMQSGRPV